MDKQPTIYEQRRRDERAAQQAAETSVTETGPAPTSGTEQSPQPAVTSEISGAGEAAPQTVDSAADDRTVNNVMRHEYRVLSDGEKVAMKAIKDKGADFLAYLETFTPSRELSLAKTKIEEAVMWAVKHITR